MAANPQAVAAKIYAVLGRPSQQVLPYRDVHAARIDAGVEILRAIARNPQHSDHGSLSTLVTVEHNSFLPAHDGEPGIPRIVPFEGGEAIEGYPADPDEIDSYRAESELVSVYSGALGVRVAHDQQDANGMPSPLSGKYSIANGVFKFTGFSAEVPLIQITRSKADEEVPEIFEPLLVKLSVGRLVKPNDPLFNLAVSMHAEGQQDLIVIAGGKPTSEPQIAIAQKQEI